MHPLIHQVLVLFLKTKKQSLHKPVPLLPSPSVSPSASSSFPWWQEGWWKCACRPLHLSRLSSSTAHRQTVPQTFLWSTSPGNETNTHSRNVYTSDKPTTTKENIFRLLFSLWMCCVPCYTYICAAAVEYCFCGFKNKTNLHLENTRQCRKQTMKQRSRVIHVDLLLRELLTGRGIWHPAHWTLCAPPSLSGLPPGVPEAAIPETQARTILQELFLKGKPNWF